MERKMIAVLDTETNWNDEVMSLGVVIADGLTLNPVENLYYIFSPEESLGGMYSHVLRYGDTARTESCTREDAMTDLIWRLEDAGVRDIFAYNARFDRGHLPELSEFGWVDIMPIAANRRFNTCIPESAECFKTGRLKRGYGVEQITRMLSGYRFYREKHNALYDAVDELKIMHRLSLPLEAYEFGRL